MPSLTDLLSDPDASIELIAGGTYLDASNTPHTIYLSQSGWDDPITGPAGYYCLPLLSTDIEINQHVKPLEPGDSFGTYSELVFMNDVTDYIGFFDEWWKYSVDQREWNLYAVGVLSDGTRVELSDVISTPLFPLLAIQSPITSTTDCVIEVRGGSYILDTPLQPDTYSPPCLVLPGTSGGAVNLGDNLDLTTSFALSIQFTTDNPSLSTAQYLLHKDSGAAGYYVAVGLVGGGTISGGVEVTFRGRSTATSTSSAGLIRAGQSYTLDISEDTAAGTRRVDLDGATIITVSSLTGTPTGNSTSLTFGMGLLGKLGRILYWSAARTNATMSAEIKAPFTGAEAGLTSYFPDTEGVGSTINDRRTGSSLTGTIGTGTVWGNSTWHYPSIIGQVKPLLIGTVFRAPVTWRDTSKQIAEVSVGGAANILELQSNHAAVTPANWTPDLSKGILTLTTGLISGTYSVTATANNLWNSALLFSSSSSATASISSPTGNRTLCVQYRPDRTEAALRYLIGWQNSNAAGQCVLRMSTGGVNRLMFEARNDTPTTFSINYDRLTEGRTYSICVSLNTTGSMSAEGQPANTAYLYLDGELVGQVALSGAWTAALTQFGVGCRGDTGGSPAMGRIDEPLVFNRTISQSEARALHLLPATGSESGMVRGWHLDEGIQSATTASPLAGATSLTLTSITWVGGRSTCVDLARWIYYRKGYTAADLDPTTWRTILNSQPSDCGLFITPNMTGKQALDIILGGLGVVRIESVGVWYLYRFEGVPLTPTLSLREDVEIASGDIEEGAPDPAIWEWEIIYATNNTPMEQSTVAQSLAVSDPDRYQYGAKKEKSAIKSDYGIKATSAGQLGRFPNAEPRARTTALLYPRDAEAEASRLLALHRHGVDTKILKTFLTIGTVQPLTGVEFDVEELEVSVTDWVIIGLSIKRDDAMVTVWRPRQE